MNDFATSFLVDQTPMEAYDAITNVRAWWSEEIDGGTAEPGEEFIYHYEDVHRCTIRVTDAVPGRRVSWLVVENHFNFTEDKTEWTGTTVNFDISEKDGQTEVRFTHHGLVPDYECFDICSSSWSFYVNGSLRTLITTGKGQPNTPTGPWQADRPQAPTPAH